jgi:hypothetical protein
MPPPSTRAQRRLRALFVAADLPPLMLAGRSASGDTIVSRASPTRLRKPSARPRRPRFLSRRKTGDVIELRRVAGSEIIART